MLEKSQGANLAPVVTCKPTRPRQGASGSRTAPVLGPVCPVSSTGWNFEARCVPPPGYVRALS